MQKFAKSLYFIAFTTLLMGCSSAHYQRSADNETYEAIAEKTSLVPGMSSEVIIDEEKTIDLSSYPLNSDAFEFLDYEANSEVGARILSLNAALDLAFKHSQEYQTQKELLYLEALALTFDRYRYVPVFNSVTSTDYQWDAQDQFVQDMADLTGIDTTSNSELLGTNESTFTNTSLGARYLLRSGGAIAVNLTSNFTRFLTGDVSEFGTGALIGSFTQPLLRDFGTAIETENLIQAERDLLYRLRDFTRFRKIFAVRVASAYFSVLLNRETVRNNYNGLLATNFSLEREQAFQAEGLSTLLQVGRLEQSSQQLDLRWATSITRYKRSLDDFKILLGLTAQDIIMLDDNEMELIAETGMDSPEITLQAAIDMAVQSRLDLYSQLDQVQDAARKVNVAANVLEPALDFSFAVSVPNSTSQAIAELDFENAVYTAGFDLDLPLDTKLNRNNYRRTIVNYAAAARNYLLAADNIRLDVVDTWRRMIEARKRYDISITSVEINERRVEEAELRAELGLGDIQDTVDSQNDLTAAQTELVSAIVQHNIAKLEFWRDVGLLYVDDSGQWEEGVDEPR